MSNKLKLIHLFSGVGSPEMALKRLGIPLEIVGYSEIDKYAIQSYKAIHGEDIPNLGDIKQIERLPKCNLLFYGFCCQDISCSGKQKGLLDENGNQTRSGLLFDVLRLLKVAKQNNELPEIAIAENVKNLVSKKFKSDFEKLLQVLDSLGYNNYWQVLNAKDYGVPQNRERVFIVSIRKDIDKRSYTFPEKMPLKKRLRDILEYEVDEKYYISQDKVQSLIKTLENKEVSNTVHIGGRGSLDRHTWDLVAIGASRGRNPENPSDRTTGSPTQQRLEINSQGLSNTLTTVQKDNLVVENRIIQIGNIVNTGNWNNPQRGRIYSSDGCSPALNTCGGGGLEPKIFEGIRIRKLTPLECWRLMSFDDEDFRKAQSVGISNTQLYKIAGNSIVTDVLYHIFRKLFIDYNK